MIHCLIERICKWKIVLIGPQPTIALALAGSTTLTFSDHICYHFMYFVFCVLTTFAIILCTLSPVFSMANHDSICVKEVIRDFVFSQGQTLDVNNMSTHTHAKLPTMYNVYYSRFLSKYFEKSIIALDLASIPDLTCQHFWQHISRHSVVLTLFRILWGMLRIRPYLIFVIFFTQAKFLKNKIYTEKMRKLRQNTL